MPKLLQKLFVVLAHTREAARCCRPAYPTRAQKVWNPVAGLSPATLGGLNRFRDGRASTPLASPFLVPKLRSDRIAFVYFQTKTPAGFLFGYRPGFLKNPFSLRLISASSLSGIEIPCGYCLP